MTGNYSLVFGGDYNSVSGAYIVSVGGESNLLIATKSSILGGGSPIDRNITKVSGGPLIGTSSVILGGKNNVAEGNYCSIGGGINRVVSSDYSYDL